jgi:hypothetical protein
MSDTADASTQPIIDAIGMSGDATVPSTDYFTSTNDASGNATIDYQPNAQAVDAALSGPAKSSGASLISSYLPYVLIGLAIIFVIRVAR